MMRFALDFDEPDPVPVPDLDTLDESDAQGKCRHCGDLFLTISEAESHIDATGHRVEYFA
jgi:hypothetical protein